MSAQKTWQTVSSRTGERTAAEDEAVVGVVVEVEDGEDLSPIDPLPPHHPELPQN